jgi:hypothetical protein
MTGDDEAEVAQRSGVLPGADQRLRRRRTDIWLSGGVTCAHRKDLALRARWGGRLEARRSFHATRIRPPLKIVGGKEAEENRDGLTADSYEALLPCTYSG